MPESKNGCNFTDSEIIVEYFEYCRVIIYFLFRVTFSKMKTVHVRLKYSINNGNASIIPDPVLFFKDVLIKSTLSIMGTMYLLVISYSREK